VARLGDRFVDGEHFEEAAFGAEDVREAFLLEGRLALPHGLPAAGAVHLRRLRNTHITGLIFVGRVRFMQIKSSNCLLLRPNE